MKYKVGDKVKIKSLEWYNSLEKDKDGNVYLEKSKNYINSDMVLLFGQEAIIKNVGSLYYKINLDDGNWSWSDDMFENETMEEYTELINIGNTSKNNVCTQIDWEQRKYEIAKSYLTGYCAGESFYSGKDDPSSDCKRAIKYADELIRQLKS